MKKIKYYTPIDNSYAQNLDTGEDAFPIGTFIIGLDGRTNTRYLVLYYNKK